jgi:CheY-like chemotaxis protein
MTHDSSDRPPLVILVADDDADDCEMLRRALEKSDVRVDLHTVGDGEELLDYLHHRGRHAPASQSPKPGVILLDLNMPKKDGHEALAEIKADPTLRLIPVLVMSTSKAQEDILRTYDLGGSAFITKPVTVAKLTDVMNVIGQYWGEVVQLPEPTSEAS